MKINLSQPDITDLERNAVLEVLNTSRLSLGPKQDEFEQRVAQYAGVQYAVAVNSGTSGLHLIIRALGIKEGDEVITTPFSFIASANCILYERAKPVFVDIDPKSFNIDVNKIEEKINEKTKAILAVDVFGHSANWDRLKEIADKHELFLIEDSAEALGSEYNGRKCGSFGLASIFSFYPNKQITTGEGGVILTNDKKIADLCRSMANQGREKKDGFWLDHKRLGYNYRMSDINCALGIAQLSRIEEIMTKRKRVAKLYNERLNFPGVEVSDYLLDENTHPFVYVIKVEEKERVIKEMAEKGIQCGEYFKPIHLQSFYGEGSFPICENIAKRTVALPFYNNLQENEISSIVEALKEIV